MPFWFRNESPIENGAREWVNDRFDWLLRQFGLERMQSTRTIVPSTSFFREKYEQTEEGVRKLFDLTCGWMGIDPSSIELEFWQPEHRPGFTGQLVRQSPSWLGVFQKTDERNRITIDFGSVSVPETLLAVFSHELAHELLVEMENEADSELVTDLACVFFGMGVFNANESIENQFRINQRGEEIYGAGYLTPEMWGYALALRAWLLKEADLKYVRWLRSPIRRVFKRSLKYLQNNPTHIVHNGQLTPDERARRLAVSMPERFLFDYVSEADEVDFTEDMSPECLLLHANDLISAGDWNSARECLNEVLRVEPDNGTAFQYRTFVLIALEFYSDALDDGNSAVSREPDDPWSYYLRGAAHFYLAAHQQAIEDLTKYIEMSEERYTDHSRAYWLRGRAQAALSMHSEAIQDYNLSLRVWADWPEPYEARATSLAAIGEHERADADRAEAKRRATR